MTGRKAEGRYLTFSVAQQECAVEVQKVREILEPSVLEPVPNSASNIRWVVRLRNKVMPVVDLRRSLGQGNPGARPNHCVLTVLARGWEGPFLMGLLVDGIREVIQVWSKDLESLAAAGGNGRGEYLLGPVQYQDREVLLLDVDALSAKEAVQELNFSFGGNL